MKKRPKSISLRTRCRINGVFLFHFPPDGPGDDDSRTACFAFISPEMVDNFDQYLHIFVSRYHFRNKIEMSLRLPHPQHLVSHYKASVLLLSDGAPEELVVHEPEVVLETSGRVIESEEADAKDVEVVIEFVLAALDGILLDGAEDGTEVEELPVNAWCGKE